RMIEEQETPHAGAALAASSRASPPRGAAEVAGTAGQAKASSGWPNRARGMWWVRRGQPIKRITEPHAEMASKHASPSRAGGSGAKAAEQVTCSCQARSAYHITISISMGTEQSPYNYRA
ncbi:hypothetical protein HaLaN_16684, partial [Haematococcus lacustris]